MSDVTQLIAGQIRPVGTQRLSRVGGTLMGL